MFELVGALGAINWKGWMLSFPHPEVGAIYRQDESFRVRVIEPRQPSNLLFLQCGNLGHPVPKPPSSSILLADFKSRCQNFGILWVSPEEIVGNEKSLETFR